MAGINIGIIGGCMTCQADLKLSRLFFRVLSREFLEKNDIKCLVSLRYYNEYFRIPELAGHLIQYARPDIIILQVRPAPFIMRSELLIQNYEGRFIINPLVFSYRKIEKIEQILGKKDPVILQKDKLNGPFNKLIILPILKYNILLGNIFRLKKRAKNSLKKNIADLHRHCKENDIRLLIIGSINSYYRKNNDILSEMNHDLKIFAEAEGITYLDIFNLMNENKDHYFGPDQFHLNTEGHALVAGLLYDKLQDQPATVEKI